MNINSGLLKALSDNPELPVGLQWRLEQLAPRSLQAIHLAYGAKLIKVDQVMADLAFLPSRHSIPQQLQTKSRDVIQMQGAAKRLGVWLRQLDLPTISNLLRLVF
jgi:bifunctional pyridoxal-dependent enzyme with beta-cystathionase and maltose regulon repressor activities